MFSLSTTRSSFAFCPIPHTITTKVTLLSSSSLFPAVSLKIKFRECKAQIHKCGLMHQQQSMHPHILRRLVPIRDFWFWSAASALPQQHSATWGCNPGQSSFLGSAQIRAWCLLCRAQEKQTKPCCRWTCSRNFSTEFVPLHWVSCVLLELHSMFGLAGVMQPGLRAGNSHSLGCKTANVTATPPHRVLLLSYTAQLLHKHTHSWRESFTFKDNFFSPVGKYPYPKSA